MNDAMMMAINRLEISLWEGDFEAVLPNGMRNRAEAKRVLEMGLTLERRQGLTFVSMAYLETAVRPLQQWGEPTRWFVPGYDVHFRGVPTGLVLDLVIDEQADGIMRAAISEVQLTPFLRELLEDEALSRTD